MEGAGAVITMAAWQDALEPIVKRAFEREAEATAGRLIPVDSFNGLRLASARRPRPHRSLLARWWNKARGVVVHSPVPDIERMEENRELRYINPMEDWDGYDEP